jgi:hypothetical protein
MTVASFAARTVLRRVRPIAEKHLVARCFGSILPSRLALVPAADKHPRRSFSTAQVQEDPTSPIDRSVVSKEDVHHEETKRRRLSEVRFY